jgi:hypothetical protein
VSELQFRRPTTDLIVIHAVCCTDSERRWSYSPTTDQFVLLHGGLYYNQVLISGSAIYPAANGVPTSTALPSPRTDAAGVVDSFGRCWMMGGSGYNAANVQTVFADLYVTVAREGM